MTRETKIGLLVGLGFIVVFAVLLSHTGSVPPPGESISPAMVENQPGLKPVLSGDIRSEIGQPEPAPPAVEAPRVPGSSPEAEPVRWPVEDRVVSIDDLPELPAPTLLEPLAVPGELARAEAKRGEVKVENPVSILGMHRTAPALPQPEAPKPTVPHDPPAQSAPPAVAGVQLAENSSNKTAPPLSPPKEYTVQSKDSLVKIAKKHYNSSDQRLIDILVKSNEGRIKDADTIREGQTLLIPDLPPEWFERASDFDVRLASGRAMTMEEFIREQGRKAPAGGSPARDEARRQAAPADDKPVKAVTPRRVEDSAPRLSLSGLVPVRPTASKESSANKKEAPADEKKDAKDSKSKGAEKGDQLYRWYEIKPNDTLGTIARKELGSTQHWTEIKKLNSGIEPQRMRPGDRIKLPRKPVSRSSENGRTSA